VALTASDRDSTRCGATTERPSSRARQTPTQTPGLPLFPIEPVDAPRQPLARAPLGVRRAIPAVPKQPARGPDSVIASKGMGAQARSRRPVSGVEAAPPLIRMVAGLCDAVLLGGLDAAVLMLTFRLTGLSIESVGLLPLPPLVAFLLLLDGSYVVGLTAVGGQTVGKMACGVCVVDQTGATVSTPAAVARAGWAVVALVTVLGVLWMFVDRDRRALHDHLAGTRVTIAD